MLNITFNQQILEINNLEPTGCCVYKLNLENKAHLRISKLNGLHIFIINKNNFYNIKKVKLIDNFDIQYDSELNEISLVIIADTTFVQNEKIKLIYYYI